ncbi:hypothetical protein COCOR_02976 [Corallococcus coralloides DSM 2259]|uniref:Lipoprotein n=1 Tax=Corallococcus coralloides (strain ATCC 25202 / DSM 2259 / NBRC 100086 / M2) TaxID=1144275 RepID=H8N097_CORCM|nr:hypothetical protein [Corallococcus coralloides]AFE04955.1 hypothetical protein COCOR_02976 [Corallococcus coralloides DSM 2259]
MKSLTHLRWFKAALVAVLGLGCAQESRPEEQQVTSQKQRTTNYIPMFCAIRPHQPDYGVCERPPQTPQGVYDQLAAIQFNQCGTDLTCRYQPIQLWATEPDANASPAEIATWFDVQNQVIDFLKTTQKNAETLHLSLSIHSGGMKIRYDEQNQIIAEVSDRLNTITKNVETQVKTQASAYGDPVVLEAAEVKAGMTRLDQAVAEARTALEALSPQVVSLVGRFETYRNTEAASVTALQALAAQGSMADLQGIEAALLAAADLSHQESGTASTLAMDARRLRSQLARAQEDYAASLVPHREFIQKRGLLMGDLVVGERKMVEGIEGYCEARKRKTLTTVERLVEGMKQRREALIALEADQATRQALADEAFLTASQRFLSDVTTRSTQLWQVAPKSTVLKLSFLSEKFDQMESYLQFEPACAPPAAGARSWREAGCIAMRRDFSRVRSWRTSTLPGTLRLNVAMMRQAGSVPAAMLAEVETLTTAGQFKAAATVHDAALRVSDGM